VFRVAAISAPLFWGNDRSQCSCVSFGDDLFPMEFRGRRRKRHRRTGVYYNLGQVTLRPRVTISHRAHICAGTHDYTKPDFPLLRPPILIGAEAWICADAFVGPGVTIGEGAIVGARAVAMKDVQPWSIVIGNPAHETKRRGTTQ
jgi:acetyltransferase-like isoleucine patch superfamily enzyme